LDVEAPDRHGTLLPMPLNFALGGKVYEPVERTITGEEIQAYAAASGDSNPRYGAGPDQVASPIFPVVPGFPLMGAVTTDRELNVENPLMILHGEEEIVHHRPIRPGDTLVFTPTLESVEDKGRNGVFVIRVDATSITGEKVNEQRATIVVRGAGSGREQPATTKEPVPDRGTPAVSFVNWVADDMPSRYAAAGGDHNPIHLDEAVARMVGLPGVINHGLGTLSLVTGGLVEHRAGSDPARVRRVKVRFTDVVFPGSELTTRVWDTPDGHHFETVRPDGKVVMQGVFEATAG
jgi:acyl dehydratase